MDFLLHNASCLAWMQAQPTGSVQLFVCDSPYENTDLSFDKQPINWSVWWPEAKRILASNGVIVCFAAELFTLALIASNRPWYRYRMVWAKSRASRGMDKAWRPLCGHEDLVVFAPAPKAATYNPQMLRYTGPKKNCQRKDTKQAHYQATRLAMAYVDNGTRYPNTVLEFDSIGTTALHFNPTAKPLDLIEYLVLTYSNPGDLVFEPYAGDAPTGLACLKHGRRYAGCETNPEQYEWSLTRLQATANAPQLFTT